MFEKGNRVIVKEGHLKALGSHSRREQFLKEALKLREEGHELTFETFASDDPDYARCGYRGRGGYHETQWIHKDHLELYNDILKKIKSESTAL